MLTARCKTEFDAAAKGNYGNVGARHFLPCLTVAIKALEDEGIFTRRGDAVAAVSSAAKAKTSARGPSNSAAKGNGVSNQPGPSRQSNRQPRPKPVRLKFVGEEGGIERAGRVDPFVVQCMKKALLDVERAVPTCLEDARVHFGEQPGEEESYIPVPDENFRDLTATSEEATIEEVRRIKTSF